MLYFAKLDTSCFLHDRSKRPHETIIRLTNDQQLITVSNPRFLAF